MGVSSLVTVNSIALEYGGARASEESGLSRQEQLEAFAKLRADSSGEPVGIHYQADIFWLRSDGPLPIMLRAEGYSWNCVTKNPDGSREVKLHEVGYYLNPSSGDVQSKITLPTTNRTHKINSTWTTKSHYTIGADQLSVPALEGRRDVKLDLQIRPAVTIDDTFIMHEDLQSEFIPTRTGRIERDEGATISETAPPRRVSQLTSYYGNLDLALDGNSAYVPATSSSMMFSDTGVFIFDLEKPLPVVWRLFGRKVRTPERVSIGFKSMVDSDYPDFWTNPAF